MTTLDSTGRADDVGPASSRGVEIMDLVATLFTTDGRDNPYPTYAALHTYGRSIRLPTGARMLVGYDAAAAALRDPRLVEEGAEDADRVLPGWRQHSSRKVLHSTMLFVDGVAHVQMRRLAARAFTAVRVDRLRESVTRAVRTGLDRLADQAADHRSVDFMAAFAVELPISVICRILGIPVADGLSLRPQVASLTHALEPGWVYADLTAADAAATRLLDYFATQLADRRAHGRDDLLSEMVAINNAATEPLTEFELAANCVLLLLAGFETTAGLLGNGVALLGRRPELRRPLLQDRRAAEPFVAELLRYEPPIQLTSRRVAEHGVVVDDLALGCGESVIVLIAAANRDPRRFPDPDRFDPNRGGAAPLSFGKGVHVCLGSRLARLEAQLAFPMFVQRFPDFELAGPPARLDQFNLHGYETLRLALAG